MRRGVRDVLRLRSGLPRDVGCYSCVGARWACTGRRGAAAISHGIVGPMNVMLPSLLRRLGAACRVTPARADKSAHARIRIQIRIRTDTREKPRCQQATPSLGADIYALRGLSERERGGRAAGLHSPPFSRPPRSRNCATHEASGRPSPPARSTGAATGRAARHTRRPGLLGAPPGLQGRTRRFHPAADRRAGRRQPAPREDGCDGADFRRHGAHTPRAAPRRAPPLREPRSELWDGAGARRAGTRWRRASSCSPVLALT